MLLGSSEKHVKKRRRLLAQEPGESGDADAVLDVPSDTLAAVHLLVRRAPSVLPVAAVLAHELYCVVENRTEVDRELHTLQQSGAIVLVRLPCSGANKAVVLRGAYAAHVRARMERAGGSAGAADERGNRSDGEGGGAPAITKMAAAEAAPCVAGVALRRFLAHLPECCAELSIGAPRLRELLAAGGTSADVDDTVGAEACIRCAHCPHLAVKPRFVISSRACSPLSARSLALVGCLPPWFGSWGRELALAGVLVAKRDNPHLDAFWVAIPGVGTFVQYLTKGRKEIVAAIKVRAVWLRSLARFLSLSLSLLLLTHTHAHYAGWAKRSVRSSKRCCRARWKRRNCALQS